MQSDMQNLFSNPAAFTHQTVIKEFGQPQGSCSGIIHDSDGKQPDQPWQTASDYDGINQLCKIMSKPVDKNWDQAMHILRPAPIGPRRNDT